MLVCDVQWALAVDGNTFTADGAGDCHRQRVPGHNVRTSLPIPVQGTWSSSSCGSGVIEGRFTVALRPAPGAGSVTASDAGGKTGSGVLALHETVTARDCVPTYVPFISGVMTVDFD